jgi:hypothetical protein
MSQTQFHCCGRMMEKKRTTARREPRPAYAANWRVAAANATQCDHRIPSQRMSNGPGFLRDTTILGQLTSSPTIPNCQSGILVPRTQLQRRAFELKHRRPTMVVRTEPLVWRCLSSAVACFMLSVCKTRMSLVRTRSLVFKVLLAIVSVCE